MTAFCGYPFAESEGWVPATFRSYHGRTDIEVAGRGWWVFGVLVLRKSMYGEHQGIWWWEAV